MTNKRTNWIRQKISGSLGLQSIVNFMWWKCLFLCERRRALSWELWEMTLDCRLVWNSKTFWRFLMLIYDSFFAVTLVTRQHVPTLRIKWTFETPKLTKIEEPGNTEYWIISQTDTQKQNSEKYSDAWCANEPTKQKKYQISFCSWWWICDNMAFVFPGIWCSLV